MLTNSMENMPVWYAVCDMGKNASKLNADQGALLFSKKKTKDKTLDE